MLICLVLLGCSSLPFFYNRAPTLAYWWLDSYVDFDTAQTRSVQAAVNDWFRWHRRTQLPAYAALLGTLEREVRAPLTATRVCEWNDEVQGLISTSVAEAIPPLAKLAATITAEQQAHLARHYAEEAETLRDEQLSGTRAEQAQRQAEEMLEAAEDLYGRFDRQQRKKLIQALAASPFDAARWLAERDARHQDLLAALTALQLLPVAERPAEAEAVLRRLADGYKESPRAAYREYQQAFTRFNCALIADIHANTTAAQRDHAGRELRAWAEALRELTNAAHD